MGGLTNIPYGHYLLKNVTIYNTTSNIWSVGPTLPDYNALGDRGAFYKGIIYIVGGENNMTYYPNLICKPTLLAYNVSNSSGWYYLANMSNGSCYSETEAINGYLYVVGGIVNGTVYTPTNGVERYNISSNTWETLESLPYTARALALASYNGTLYISGGYTGYYGNSMYPTNYFLKYQGNTKYGNKRNFELNENFGNYIYDKGGINDYLTISGATWANDGVLVELKEGRDYTYDSLTGELNFSDEYVHSWVNVTYYQAQESNDSDITSASEDECPNTPSGESENSNGCSCSQITIPFRTCPSSKCEGENFVTYPESGYDVCVAGEIVSEYSCAALSSVYSLECDLDDDNDGVPDSEDTCPNDIFNDADKDGFCKLPSPHA